jgi:2-polyprenyl-6-methoxyphenol hydroxylase-like FAD-dependent oxidoreductase
VWHRRLGDGKRRCLVCVLIVGAGVIGSVYARRLVAAGHAVTLCARADRLAELKESGLVLVDAHSGQRVCHEVAVVGPTDAAGLRCDLALVAVRRDQMITALPLRQSALRPDPPAEDDARRPGPPAFRANTGSGQGVSDRWVPHDDRR